MKLFYLTGISAAFAIVFLTTPLKAQQNDELLKLLIKKRVLTQQEADSLKAQAALDAQKKPTADLENQHGIYLGRALQISGLIQARYQGFQQSTAINSFDLHRARLDVKGDLTDNWDYEVYTEFAGTTKLLDAYTDYKVADFLKFTAGQFKVPFSLESLIADSQLELIDRSQVVEALAGRSKDVIGNQNGRDIGAQVSGSFLKLNGLYFFDYTFGVFNGAGYDVTTDNNNHKDIAARLVIHPVKGLGIGADFYNGLDQWGTPLKNQTRNRRGIDGRYEYGALTLTAEYDRGTDGTINRNGWFGQAAYFVWARKLQLVARYDTYDSNTAVINSTTNWYEGGLNYFFNKWAKLMVDYSLRREEGTQINNNVFETQLQVTF
jgi:phosphate-selective porin